MSRYLRIFFLLMALQNVLAADDSRPSYLFSPQRGATHLMQSVQNEANAAIARARTWLATQGESGVWLEDDEDCTGLVLLAIYPGSASIIDSNVLTKAIDTIGATNHLENTREAWRWLALVQYKPKSEIKPVERLKETAEENPRMLTSLLIMREARLAGASHLRYTDEIPTENADPAYPFVANFNSGVTIPYSEGKHLAYNLAREWNSAPVRASWRECTAERAWWLARAINRLAHGVLLLEPDRAIDWRGDLADYWINRQRVTAQGDGYWQRNGRPSISETAFAILLLQEL